MKEKEKKPGQTGETTGLEVAVIGMAVRFPGAENLGEFLYNLKNGIESIWFFSHEELEAAGIDPEVLEHPGFIAAKGYLPGGDYFDAEFFGYTPLEAAVMDPQVRIFHECAWEALEDAGYDPAAYDGLIGLYAGASLNIYWQLLRLRPGYRQELDSFSVYQLINKDNLTTWVSYTLDLKGPSYAMQTACSTSLAAIHTAAQALLSGECHIALAGGVTAPYPREAGYIYQEGMIGSPDGHCRVFDAAARGTIGGEGCGVVVLKLLEDASQDRDHIYALIKGSALNNDGRRKTGYTAPSVKAQAAVIKAAWKMAGVEPGTIGYLEAHGTGTVLGDPIEIEALKQAFPTGKKNFCAVGSVKSNFGHLDSAAGVAGFVKAVLSLEEKVLFPSLHFQTPNPNIDFEAGAFFVPTGLGPWRNNHRPLRAGVSSFGIGGTNAHVVLEEWPDSPSSKAGGREQEAGVREQGAGNTGQGAGEHPDQLLLLSARTPTALDKMTENLLNYFKNNWGRHGNQPNHGLPEVAYTLQRGRRHFKYRITAVSSTVPEAIAALSGPGTQGNMFQAGDKPRVIFMFPGIGGQWLQVNPGQELYRTEPVFRAAMDRCMGVLTPGWGGWGRDLKGPLDPQPLLLAFEYALVQLLKKWGITPYALIGYSYSEYTAAVVSGVFSLEEALKLVVARARLLKKLPAGAMLSVPLPADRLKPLLEREENQGVYLAIDNGPACIVSGTAAKIGALEDQLKKQRLIGMRLPGVAYAAHSPTLAPILKEFEAAVREMKLNKPQIPYLSNVTGQWITEAEACDPRYWGRHISSPVLFSQGIRELEKIPRAVFIEVGPGRELTLLVRRLIHPDPAVRRRGPEVVNLLRQAPGLGQPGNLPTPGPLGEGDTVNFLLQRLGYLWGCGVEIDWNGFSQGRERRRVPLPTYPFEHRHYGINKEILAYWRRVWAGKTGQETVPAVPVFPGEKASPPLTGNTSNLTFKSQAAAGVPYSAPQDPIQETLVKIWQHFFGITGIGIHHDFFDLGGDSLKAMNVSNLVRREMQVEIPVAEFFQRQTIAGLADYIREKAQPNEFLSIPPVEKKEYYPLTTAQRRIFILQQLGENQTGYNEPIVVELQGNLEKEKPEATFKQLIHRHESLRTSFIMKENEPVQRIHEAVKFEIEGYELEAEETTNPKSQVLRAKSQELRAKSYIKHFIRPFELSRAPLVRVGLVEQEETKYILIVDLHHIISDGTTQTLLVNDFVELYNGQELPGLRIQYKDFSRWQNQLIASGKFQGQESFWLERLSGPLPELEMPYDYPRPAVFRYEGSSERFELNPAETTALKHLALNEEVSLFMLLLTLFNVLLFKLSNQEDIIVGAPIAGRRNADLQQVIGVFINTLALRNYPCPEKSSRYFLNEVKKNTLEAFDNQDYPFDDLVEKVVKTRDTGRNPLFDVMFALQNLEVPKKEIPGLTWREYPFDSGNTRFDMALRGFETGEQLYFTIEYSTALFKRETMARFGIYFKIIIDTIAANPEKKLGEIDLLSKEERQKILGEFNETAADYPADKTIYELFAEQVERAPDHMALVGEKLQNTKYKLQTNPKSQATNSKPQIHMTPQESGWDYISITYSELNQKSCRWAHTLKEKGVELDTIVAIKMERSLEMVIGVLGILKAGSAYLPIDPNYPQERINFMLADSGAKILVTTGALVENVGAVGAVREPPLQLITLPFIVPENTLSTSTSQPPGFHLLPATGNRPPATSLAYIIYTSGTTGKPKGVMIPQTAVVNFIYSMYNKYAGNFGPGDHCMSLTNPGFDVSVAEIFIPLVFGSNLVLLPPGKRFEPEAIAKTIIDESITFTYLPPGVLKEVYEHLKALVSGTPLELNKMLVGVEPIKDEVLENYLRLNPLLRLVNGYGPTEATICATAYKYESCTPGGSRVPIGSPLANTRVILVDSHFQLVPVGIPGELCISGDGLARGYLNNPELTNEKFCLRRPGGSFRENRPLDPHKSFLLNHSDSRQTLIGSPRRGALDPRKNFLFDQSPITLHHSLLYRTGDLAKWLPDGNILFIGRRDQQVKIRGFRIELGEIENRLQAVNPIKEAVVVAREDKTGEKYLCAYFTAGSALDDSTLRTALSRHLPEYMIPAGFVQLEKIPLTPHGKVDRRALPQPEFKTKAEYTAPRNTVEVKLAAIWSEVLGEPEPLSIGIDENFFALGGHSLKAMVLVMKIHRELKVKIPLTKVFTRQTIRKLAEYIEAAEEKKYTRYVRIDPVEKRDYYELSPAQERMYFLQQMEVNSTAYNLPLFAVLEGELDQQRVEKVFQKLIQRHESLRTSFAMKDGKFYQRIHEEVKFEMEGYELEAEETANPKSQEPRARSYIKRFIRPFDLTLPPLFRAGLIQRGEKYHILMVDQHHIISDGTSMVIMVREFMALYQGMELPPLRVQYRDYAQWRNSEKEKSTIKNEQTYWEGQFLGDIPVLELPIDFPRPPVQSFAGSFILFPLEKLQTRVLKELALNQEVTLFMLLMAVYNVFLAKISGQEDIVVGTPTAGRDHADIQPLVGMFVNTLALRSQPIGSKTFTAFLKETREITLNAFANQEYPFENLVEQVCVTRDPARSPLFDTMFILQNFDIQGSEIPVLQIPGLKLKPYDQYETQTTKFDLTLSAGEAEETLVFGFEYCTRLFKKETIARFIKNLRQVITAILENPDLKISEIEILSAKEKQQMIADFNQTAAGYPEGKTLHQLFTEQVERTPGHIALVGEKVQNTKYKLQTNSKSQVINNKPQIHVTQQESGWDYISITYTELNQKSWRLAHTLKEKGVEPDTIVAIKMERSLEMVISILGILKAGGAYLPIDPNYPPKRRDFMLADSGAKILVTTDALVENVGIVGAIREPPLQLITLGKALSTLNSQPPGFHLLPATGNRQPATSLAYIIYTSGTTGKPKGVMVEHYQVVRLMVNDRFPFDFNPQDVWTFFHSVCFDFSVWEMYGALLYDGKLIVIPTPAARNIQEYLEIIKKQGVTILNQTPSAFYLLQDLELENPGNQLKIRYVIFGGEALRPGRLKKWKAKYPHTTLINMYGITETTVHVTFKEITPKEIESDCSNIGKPIPTLSIYIMDKYLKLVPPGVAGELVVGGKGVSRGYMNRPELTAEKFCLRRPGGSFRENLYRHPAPRGLDSRKSFLLNHSDPQQALIGSPRRGALDPRKNFLLDQSPITLHHSLFYRTGDLARRLANGDLEYLGRLDQQVKIRGYRIELGEIENRLLAIKTVKAALVLARENPGGEKYLCAYYSAFQAIDEAVLRAALSQQLPEYMIPAYFIPLELIPLTPQGKVDRRALPNPGIKGGTGSTPPRDQIEQKLAAIWSEVLEIPGAVSLGIDDNFFQLGGHSLKATVVNSRIFKEFNLKLPLAVLFSYPTIRKLSAVIRQTANETSGAETRDIPRVEQREYYPLSYNQQRLYILQNLEPGGSAFNLPGRIEIQAPVDPALAAKVLDRLAQRHESFRTAFWLVEGQPVQVIQEKVKIPLRFLDLSQLEAVEQEQEQKRIYTEIAAAPFDLAQAPLIRSTLLKLGRENYWLMFNLHHIISDGWSLEILQKEFADIYRESEAGEATELEPLKIQYRDFAWWQHRQVTQVRFKEEAHRYWQEKLPGFPRLSMPRPAADLSSEPTINERKGAGYLGWLENTTAQKIRDLARESQMTPFNLMFAIYILWLYRFFQPGEIGCSIIHAGRELEGLHPVVGFFVNSIPIRLRVEAEEPFKALLHRVYTEILAAFHHQSYPPELACEDLGLRYPEIQVSFNLLNLRDPAPVEAPPRPGTPHVENAEEVKFDIEPYVREFKTGLQIYWVYRRVLFDPATFEFMAKEYTKLVEFFTTPANLEKSFKEYKNSEPHHTFKRKESKSC